MPKAEAKVKRTQKVHIYRVEVDGEVKLIRAMSRSRAKNYVLNRTVTISIPSQDELVDLIKTDIAVEDAIKAE